MLTLKRSLRLLASYPQEQKNPSYFYKNLAEDTRNIIAGILGSVHSCAPGRVLSGKKVLDVGGGPGFFAHAFEESGAWYIPVEPDVGEMAAAGIHIPGSVRGSGLDLPFRDSSFDIVYSSNVAEHVPDWQRMGNEMFRVTAPGGVMILSYTIWLGPFGGHETGLWAHYIGGAFARDRYTRKYGHPPKNSFGTTLFNVSCKEGIDWARQMGRNEDCAGVSLFPRYHPWWARWLVHIPGIREFLVSNLVIVLHKKSA